jgi:hypothetical protein
MEFVHCGNTAPTKDSWQPCDVSFHHMMNIPKEGFFLSRKEPVYGSYWSKHRMEKGDDYWTKMHKTVYTLSHESKILHVDYHNARQIFKKYGKFTPPDKRYDTQEFVKEVETLLQFLEGFKYKYNPDDIDEITKIKNKFHKKQSYIPKPTKRSFRDWCGVIARLEFLYDTIHKMTYGSNSVDDYEYMIRYYGYYELDYDMICSDGYDGIYYPYELFTNTVKFTKDDLYIRYTLKSLGTDTLLVWNWCFSPSTQHE